ncbi:MAG: transglutaminase family protein [Planctomycetaceae bacterium]
MTIEFLDGVPGLKINTWLNSDGDPVMAEVPLLGSASWDVPKEVAIEEIPDDIDLGLSTLIETAKIERPYDTRRVQYKVRCAPELPTTTFAGTGTQRVESLSDDTVQLTVESVRPGDLPAGGAAAAEPDAGYLAATALANCNDEAIKKLALKVGNNDLTPAEIAVAAERAVHEWLTKVNMSNNMATASEVVRSREGDCTEHSFLLTAVLRARGIPARAVVGLVYVEPQSAFAGHAWAEAWINGRWVPLDATLARGGIGATHIKLADSDLADGAPGLIVAAISTWRLLDKAEIELLDVEHPQ